MAAIIFKMHFIISVDSREEYAKTILREEGRVETEIIEGFFCPQISSPAVPTLSQQ